MVLFRSIQLTTFLRRRLDLNISLLQQRRSAKRMVLTFGGANKIYYVNTTALQIDVPTFSGDFGILAGHVPTIAVLRPGLVKVIETNLKDADYFVSSGTVSVLADSTVQVLAEEAWMLKDLDFGLCQDLVKKYTSERKRSTTDVERVKADIALMCARSMYAALQSTQIE